MTTKTSTKARNSTPTHQPTLDVPQGLVPNEVGAWAWAVAAKDPDALAAIDSLLGMRRIDREIQVKAADLLAQIKEAESEWRRAQQAGASADEIVAINRRIHALTTEHSIVTLEPIGARRFVRSVEVDKIAATAGACDLAFILAEEYPERLGSWVRSFASAGLPSRGAKDRAEAAQQARDDAANMELARPERRTTISKVMTSWEARVEAARGLAETLLGD
jgi:hypothetical protein